ncbi:hypothetical protein ACEN2P_19485 [Pedobacter psychrotolerans]
MTKKLALKLYHSKAHTVKEICSMMEISKPTLYNYVKNESKKHE